MAKQLDLLLEKKKQLEARILKLEASKKAKERKEDTRRKIMIGAYYLDQAKKNNSIPELYNMMRKYITRDFDKKLFQ